MVFIYKINGQFKSDFELKNQQIKNLKTIYVNLECAE